jgi:hypothetical protein
MMRWLGSFLVAGSLAAAAPDYRRDVLPILRDYCAGCHNATDLEGGWSVETHAEFRAGGESGEPILVPGDAAASYFLRTIRREAKPAMPPKKEPQPSPAEIAVLEAWVNAGAIGPKAGEDLSLRAALAVPDVAGYQGERLPVTALAASPDGTRIAVARHGRIGILAADTLRPVGGFAVGEGKTNALHWSADGTRLLVATGVPGLNGRARVLDARDGKVLLEVGEGHRDVLYDAEWSPDGTLLATAGYDQTIRLWNAADGTAGRVITGHNGAVYDLAFSPDGTLLASASADQTGKIWQVATGERLDTLNQPQGAQLRIAFTPDGRHVVGAGADNRIRVWTLRSRTGPEINPVLHARFAHEGEVVQFGFDAAARHLLSAAADGHVKLWTLPDLRLVRDWEHPGDVVSGLAWAGGSFVTASLSGELRRHGIAADGAGPEGGAREGAVAAAAPGGTATGPGEASRTVRGVISRAGEVDDLPFEAVAGETWILEVDAARSGSELDSRVEVLTADGQPVERVVLRAVRDSWFTFRGKDSDTSDDFRVQNWREMELNEYLYCNGEVVKLWHYPRGPDSGFKVYPGAGKRHAWFDTSPLAHALGEPCYIVEPLPPGSRPVPNGLPVYRLTYANDDDATRAGGKDSRLTFTAPADGTYLARIGDVRGFGGETFSYALTIRRPQPGFTVAVGGKDAKPGPGSGKEVSFTVTRRDGFEGPVTVEVADLPPGFTSSAPTTIEEGQRQALVTVRAEADAPMVPEGAAARVRVRATAEIGGQAVVQELGDLGNLVLGTPPKVRVRIEPEQGVETGTVELVLRPGETIWARVTAERNGFEGQIDLGKDDAGRNLPHGVYVDNIGLNGLMIPEGQTGQRFSLTAAPWVRPQERWFHLMTPADGGQVTQPVRLRIVE